MPVKVPVSSLPAFSMLGSGPTVLMLHGVGGGHDAFAPQLEHLATQGYRAVAWDMPGYGRSAPVQPYHFKGLAERCIALIDSLQAAPVVLVGHSMGGMVAQEVMARRPDCVRALVLCGTSAAFGKPDGDWQTAFLAERYAPLDMGCSMAELAAQLVPAMIGPRAWADGVALAQRCMANVPAAIYRKALAALMGFDRQAALARIHVPTLLVAGSHDRHAPPRVMKKMAREIAGSSYVELAGVGHLQNLEAPAEFDAALLSFLAQPKH